jgi:lysophospholipase L1-like esterase
LTKDYFAGKRVLLIGDSITAGVGTTKTYGEYLSESLGVTVTNKGSSGSGYCSGGAMATNKNLTEANVRNADIITIMLGVNDWDWAVKEGSWKGNPEYYDKSQTYYQLGDFDSTDTSTFYGALHAWCQKILAMQQIEGFEDKQFIVITPLITSWNVSVTGRKDWNQDKLNIHGHTFREYCTAIMEVCAYYDIPVFDANMFSGIYYKSAEDNNVTETGGDGVHVNAAGHALLAEALEEFLLEGYAYESRSVKNSAHTYVNGICTDCRLPYVCNHTYNAVVTVPTCTEQGYTTHTCSCGESYVDSYTEMAAHAYANGLCTACGAAEPYTVGDLNQDGIIDTADVVHLRRYIAGGYGITLDPTAADLNGDGVLTSTDVVILRRYIAGGYGIELPNSAA